MTRAQNFVVFLIVEVILGEGIGMVILGLVRDVEEEIMDWLAGGTMLLPDTQADDLANPGYVVGVTGTVIEISRTPLRLVWSLEDDAFARYVVHCCAR